MNPSAENQSGKKGRIIQAVVLSIVVVALLILCYIFRNDLLRFARDLFGGKITKEDAKVFMRSFGWHGMVVIPVFSMFQVILTVLPAEPVQVVAGMSYGLWGGVGLCMVGVFVGNNIMFLLSRTLGSRLTGYFRKNIQVDLTAGASTWRVSLAVLVLYVLPAIPYGLICFMTASTGMKYWRYIVLTTIGSLPSVLIGAGVGVIAIEMGFIIAFISVGFLVVLLIAMFFLRNKIFAAINRAISKSQKPYTTAHRVRKPNRFIYGLSAVLVGGFVKHKIKVQIANAYKHLPRPCVVLCNHPSFIDWVYAALAIRPDCGNFIISRYYYFQRNLAWLVKQVGTLPKSMFTVDIESARNAYRVIKENGILCLMPEAHLSTDGQSGGISDMTAKMLHSFGVPVYTVHLDGAYLAKPKWGKGFRKGSRVEVRVDKLADADEVKAISPAELHERIVTTLAYNDFTWLQTRPELHYKNKNLAEGLENILLRCPDCGAECTLTTQGTTIECSACGCKAVLSDRYQFTRVNGKDTPLPQNPQDWYVQVAAQVRQEIESDPGYVLRDNVILKFPDPTGKHFFTPVGEGVCSLSREGFRFEGTVHGEPHVLEVAQRDMYRILFGAGEEFEIYHEKDYYYFVPQELRL